MQRSLVRAHRPVVSAAPVEEEAVVWRLTIIRNPNQVAYQPLQHISSSVLQPQWAATFRLG
jgi:hypothetical protein